jgi:hypothetical protein
VSQSWQGISVASHIDVQGKVVMRWEYPGEIPPKWKPVVQPVVTPMAPPPLKLKIKLKVPGGV